MKGLKCFKTVVRIPFLGLFFAISAFAVVGQNPHFLESAKNRIHKEFASFERPRIEITDVCEIETDPLSRRVFWEYGSIFVADNAVRLPDKCVFTSASAVQAFQEKIETRKEIIGSVEIELQKTAMNQLLKAVGDAAQLRLTITPLDGRIAGSRSFDDTVRLWNSRVFRALDHWTARRKIARDEAEAARNLSLDLQIRKIVEWEAIGIYFSTNFSKSIFYSVAPPGTSQHLSLLAFDVVEANDHRIRAIMNKYGWFQTIRTDKPHFTFLGVAEAELPNRGLRNMYYEGDPFWVTSIEPFADARAVP